MVAVAGDGDVVDDTVGHLAQHIAGQQLERQLEAVAVAVEVGHPVEQATEVTGCTEFHRAGCQIICADHAHGEQLLVDRRIAVARRDVRLAAVEPHDDPRRGAQGQLAGEAARACCIEHGPDRARALRFELQEPARRAEDCAAWECIVHRTSHRSLHTIP